MKSKLIHFFILLQFLYFFGILLYSLEGGPWNEFKDKVWEFDNGGIYFILNKTDEDGNSLYFYNPERTWERTYRAGDASITIQLDSCGYHGYTSNLNPFSNSISCSCRPASCFCPDIARADITCDANVNEGSCYTQYIVEDGGTCSCSCQPTSCSNCSLCCCGTQGVCTACTGGNYKSSSFSVNPVDTTQFDGECINVNLVKLDYKKAEMGAFDIKWYREPSISLDIEDACNDIDSLEEPDFSGYMEKPEFSVTQLSSNSFRVDIKVNYEIPLEDYFDLYLTMQDNDICIEKTLGNLIFAIDHLGPHYFKVDLHPFGYISNLSNAYDIKAFNIESYLKQYFTLNFREGLDILVGVKGLSYCKFKGNPCFVFHLVDIGSTIKDVEVSDEIGLGMPSYSLEDSSVSVSIIDNEGNSYNADFPSKKFTINYQENSKSFTLLGIDKLDNKNIKIFMLFPFDTPKSECEVEKEVNGYTNFPFIKCKIEAVNGKINSGDLYFTLDTQKEISEVKVKFSKDFKDFNIEEISPDKFYKIKIKEENYLTNTRYNYRGVMDNVDLVYFSFDEFLNAENVQQFNFNDLEATIKPNKLTVSLDLEPPTLYVTSNDLMMSDGNTVNNVNVYDLELENLEILQIPATIQFNCQDPGSGSCIINVTLSNGKTFQLNGGSSITIDEYVGFIEIEFSDELGNKANPVILKFNANLIPPTIDVNFDIPPLLQGSTYYFVDNVTMFVNANVEGDSSKIKEICVNVGSGRDQCSSGSSYQVHLGCEIGSKCEYLVKIKAKSVVIIVARMTENNFFCV